MGSLYLTYEYRKCLQSWRKANWFNNQEFSFNNSSSNPYRTTSMCPFNWAMRLPLNEGRLNGKKEGWFNRSDRLALSSEDERRADSNKMAAVVGLVMDSGVVFS